MAEEPWWPNRKLMKGGVAIVTKKDWDSGRRRLGQINHEAADYKP